MAHENKMSVVHLYKDRSHDMQTHILNDIIILGIQDIIENNDQMRFTNFLIDHKIYPPSVDHHVSIILKRMKRFINCYLDKFQGPEHASNRAHPHSHQWPVIYHMDEMFPYDLPIPPGENNIFRDIWSRVPILPHLPTQGILHRGHNVVNHRFLPWAQSVRPQFNYSMKPYVWPLLFRIHDRNTNGRLKYRPWTMADGPLLIGLMDAMRAIRPWVDVEYVGIKLGDNLELPPPFGPRCFNCSRLLRPSVRSFRKKSVPRWCRWCPSKFRNNQHLIHHHRTSHGPDRCHLDCQYCMYWKRTVYFRGDYVTSRTHAYDLPTIIVSMQE